MSIEGIDVIAVARLHHRRTAASTVIAAIKQTSARRRRESSRRRWGSAPLHPSHSSSSIAVAVTVVAAVAIAVAAVAVAVESLHRRRGRQVHRARRRERRCLRSVRREGVIVNNYAANGAPDAAAMTMLTDGVGGVGGGKNGVGGGSSTNRDNDGHDADGDRRCCPRPRPCWASMAVAMMMMAGKRGARRWRGDCRARTR